MSGTKRVYLTWPVDLLHGVHDPEASPLPHLVTMLWFQTDKAAGQAGQQQEGSTADRQGRQAAEAAGEQANRQRPDSHSIHILTL